MLRQNNPHAVLEGLFINRAILALGDHGEMGHFFGSKVSRCGTRNTRRLDEANPKRIDTGV